MVVVEVVVARIHSFSRDFPHFSISHIWIEVHSAWNRNRKRDRNRKHLCTWSCWRLLLEALLVHGKARLTTNWNSRPLTIKSTSSTNPMVESRPVVQTMEEENKPTE